MAIPTTKRRQLYEWAALLTIVTIGAFIRTASIGWSSLERDEAQTLGFLTEKNPILLIRAIVGDSNPPLIHLIFWPLVQTFGNWIAPEKFVALAISSALPLFCFILLKRRYGTYVALHSSFLTALSPVLIRFGELIRCYGLLHITALWATVAFFDLIQREKSAKLKYLIAVTSSMYLHLSFAIVAAGHGISLAVSLLTRQSSYRVAVDWLKVYAVFALLFSPWLFVVIWQLHHQLQPWNYSMPPLEVFWITVLNLFVPTPHEQLHMNNLVLVLMCFIVMGFKTQSAARARQWLLILVGGIATFVVLTQIGFPGRERYVSILSPLAMVVLSMAAKEVALAQVNSKWKSVVLFAVSLIPAIYFILISILDISILICCPESEINRIASEFSPLIRKDKDLVVVSWESACPEVSRTLDPSVNIVAFPDLERVKVVRWDGLNDRIRDDEKLTQLCRLMSSTLARGGNIWLISKHLSETPPAIKDLHSQRYMDIEDMRIAQIQNWLLLHATMESNFYYKAREYNAAGMHFVPIRNHSNAGRFSHQN